MFKILCQSALSAVTLTAVLTAEGHVAMWFMATQGPAVATNAPLTAIAACVATTENTLRVPKHLRTVFAHEGN